ncbi:MAG: GNAT family N-acetyltransferase [Rubricella sp.]
MIRPAPRPALPGDTERLATLYRESYSALMADAYPAAVLDAALGPMTGVNAALIASGRYFVIEEGRRILAAGGWSPHPPAREDGEAHIRHFATHPAALGRGHGSAIMRLCLAQAEAEGIAALACYASLNAEGFYARHGFAVRARREIPIRGVAFPVVEMVRTPRRP